MQRKLGQHACLYARHLTAAPGESATLSNRGLIATFSQIVAAFKSTKSITVQNLQSRVPQTTFGSHILFVPSDREPIINNA
jgi:hypothetical protein